MSFNIYRNRKDIDPEKYMFADYILNTSGARSVVDVRTVARELAIGQSVGNPNVRNRWESDELFEKHSCLVVENEIEGSNKWTIAFPVINTNIEEDGISHLLCQMMGGQMDIDIVGQCRLLDFHLPLPVAKNFEKPAVGLSGLRLKTGHYGKPFSGGIVKPKTGVSPQILLEMVKEMVGGGVDFIKEDEILADPSFCSLKERVPLISSWLSSVNFKGVYCFCINGDPHTLLNKAKFVSENSDQGVHLNVWSGLGAYRSVRKQNKNMFIHYQKSGDKTFTDPSGKFSISWKVLLKFAILSGVDSIHAGMLFGYLSDNPEELRHDVEMLNLFNVIPALSCGMQPGLVDAVRAKVGENFIANVGGALHGHPDGTYGGARAMRQAIDRTGGGEFMQAIQKWGYQKP